PRPRKTGLPKQQGKGRKTRPIAAGPESADSCAFSEYRSWKRIIADPGGYDKKNAAPPFGSAAHRDSENQPNRVNYSSAFSSFLDPTRPLSLSPSSSPMEVFFELSPM